MQHLEVRGVVRPLYGSLGIKELIFSCPIAHADQKINGIVQKKTATEKKTKAKKKKKK